MLASCSIIERDREYIVINGGNRLSFILYTHTQYNNTTEDETTRLVYISQHEPLRLRARLYELLIMRSVVGNALKHVSPSSIENLFI